MEQLLAEQGGKLYRIGLRICGNHEDAEDLVQETFLTAYKSWDQFRGESSPSTWLYTIASRICQRQKRLRAGEPRHKASLSLPDVGNEDFVLELPQTGPDPFDDQIRRESRETVEHAISTLPLDFRMPLVLKEIAGLPLAEIASILETKEATIKTRIHRGRLLLRQALTEELPRKQVETGGEVVCVDLIQAKQEALDKGLDFPVDPELLGERCRSLFDTLDFSQRMCRDIGSSKLPESVRSRLIEILGGEDEDPAAKSSEEA